MADVTKTVGLMEIPDKDNVVFGGDHKSVKVTKAVNRVQLSDEIEAALGDPDAYNIVMQVDNHDAQVSTDNPLTIYIHPQNVDMKAVEKAVREHSPQDDYGLTEEQKELSALLKRLATGDLGLPDINKILRFVVLG